MADTRRLKTSFGGNLYAMFEMPCVEPEKRMVAGRYGWACHRFPIKGGKSRGETIYRDALQRMADNVTRNNALINHLMAKTPAKSAGVGVQELRGWAADSAGCEICGLQILRGSANG
ncbi:hypothetical protein WIX39_026235 [Variovorax sp. AB1(2024)]|uniref:hypothetical protein n=1 Tax=Variovorax sp. AB1(2024) TaxID=3132214 RepID=UPI0030A0CC76